MKNKHTLIIILIATSLAACEKQNKSLKPPELAPTAPAPAPAPAPESSPASINYHSISIANIEKEITFLTLGQITRGIHPDYVAAVTKQKLLTDDTLALYDKKYKSEEDAFKREEIKKESIPEIKKAIEKFSKIQWIKFELYDIKHPDSSSDGKENLGRRLFDRSFSNFFMPYDLEKKLFPTHRCYDQFKFEINRTANSNSALWQDVPGKEMPPLCEINVEDIELAKKMEGARATKGFGYLSIRYYLHIPPGDAIPDHNPRINLLAEPVMLELDISEENYTEGSNQKLVPFLTYRYERRSNGVWVGSVLTASTTAPLR